MENLGAPEPFQVLSPVAICREYRHLAELEEGLSYTDEADD